MIAKCIRQFLISVIALLPFVLYGCSGLEKAVNEYRGDGDIRYIKGPLLGRDGVVVDMEDFCLREEFSASYSLLNLPKGEYYVFYLFIPCTLDNQRLTHSKLTVRLMRGGLLLKKASSSFARMRRAEGGGRCELYFSDELHFSPGNEMSFDVDELSSDLSISISGEVPRMSDQVFVHVRIAMGGSK